MALQKDIEHETGVTLSYWMITRFVYQKVGQAGRIRVGGYKDEQTRQDAPADGIARTVDVQVDRPEFQAIYADVVGGDGDLYTRLYKHVKEHCTLLSDATDV